ncbi:MAG TPA: carbonic anhydrase [Pyrinomonadaceae bacterium]|nr:carbonic anhydrase [Pyrinomonadaceae bacterium]
MKHNALRALVVFIALTLALSSLGVSAVPRTVNSQPDNSQAKRTEDPCPAVEPVVSDANSALQALKCGNERWRNIMRKRDWDSERKATATSQRPMAVVISCMDSRVPPELVFDRGLGEVFVIRVAGPVLDTDQLASLEYALVHVGVKLVVVLGHTDCGAVKGAVDNATGTFLPVLLDKIEPAITDVSDRYNGGRRITSTNKRNLDRVSLANARLMHTQILRRRVLRQPGVQVMWGIYYLSSGEVAFEPRDVKP